MINKSRAFSLVEVIVATLILAIAFIPVSGLITSDSVATVAAARETHAHNVAAFIMNSLLDEVAFEDLLQGSPARIVGDSQQFLDRLFPDNSGECVGTFIADDGTHFNVSLRVVEHFDEDNDSLSFSAFKNPDFMTDWTNTTQLGSLESVAQMAHDDEVAGNPSYFRAPSDSGILGVYDHPDWAREESKYFQNDFVLDDDDVSFIKTLILRVRWSNVDRTQPLSDNRPRVLWLMAHKANLRIN